MRLRFDDSAEAFRLEFREWLAANRPSPAAMAAEPSVSTGHAPQWARDWTRTMFDNGWLVPGWPPERGGRNAGPVETIIYMEELYKARVPRTTNVQGLGIIAPSILDYGRPDQVEEYAMPILRGEKTACLGMSEPDAGSDLAGLKCRAVLDGDNFVINGQKVWTSGANYADFCFLFCRTDPDAPKHKGISIVLVDMNTPGITVRPLPEIIHPEHPDLNEVFFDDVVVPARNLVGELNNGWVMANGSLAHERGMVWLNNVLSDEMALAELVAQAPEKLAALSSDVERAAMTDAIVRAQIDVVAARCLGYRGFAKLVRGGDAPEQALMKWFATELRQNIALVAAELEGLDALRMGEIVADGTQSVDDPQGSWLEQYFHSFANTISAGASEIQQNIIAERVLGLPRG
ncbi:MAG TPA: acyl-CoA dehydrogenase family protein [Acidimicrobiales bacterium]|nr:acyl-CoA dehydrogenase family protein [Acidimicrobiales bacterium]